jgi:hypothetical protein
MDAANQSSRIAQINLQVTVIVRELRVMQWLTYLHQKIQQWHKDKWEQKNVGVA